MRSVLYSLILVSSWQAQSQMSGQITDERDGHTYKTIVFTIPTQEEIALKREWIAETLMYKSENSFCYNNNEAYCEGYGRYYNFEGALEACPADWRLATIRDWRELFDLYGGQRNAGESMAEGGRARMEMLFTGFGDAGGNWYGLEKEGYYWDAETQSGEKAGIVVIHKGQKEIFHDAASKNQRNAVRCIRQ